MGSMEPRHRWSNMQNASKTFKITDSIDMFVHKLLVASFMKMNADVKKQVRQWANCA